MGAVPNKESCSPFVYYQFWGMEARVLARLHQCRSSFTLPGVVQHETGIITVLPPVCLPTVCLVMKSFRPSPSVYAYRKRSKSQEWPGNEAKAVCVSCDAKLVQHTCISYTQCVFWFTMHHTCNLSWRQCGYMTGRAWYGHVLWLLTLTSHWHHMSQLVYNP